MKTKADLLAEHARELATFDAEEGIRNALPKPFRVDAMICLHSPDKKPHASVKLWNDFRTEKRIVDALAILELFKDNLIQGEHWKAGCVSTWPEQINSVIKDQGAVLDGTHEVEISVSGGKSFGPNVTINFWTMIAGWLCEIQLPVCDLWKLVPRVNATYNRYGEACKCEITWPIEKNTVDKFRTFWSEKPNYSGSYYLADYPNFLSFISNFTPQPQAA